MRTWSCLVSCVGGGFLVLLGRAGRRAYVVEWTLLVQFVEPLYVEGSTCECFLSVWVLMNEEQARSNGEGGSPLGSLGMTRLNEAGAWPCDSWLVDDSCREVVGRGL